MKCQNSAGSLMKNPIESFRRKIAAFANPKKRPLSVTRRSLMSQKARLMKYDAADLEKGLCTFQISVDFGLLTQFLPLGKLRNAFSTRLLFSCFAEELTKTDTLLHLVCIAHSFILLFQNIYFIKHIKYRNQKPFLLGTKKIYVYSSELNRGRINFELSIHSVTRNMLSVLQNPLQPIHKPIFHHPY